MYCTENSTSTGISNDVAVGNEGGTSGSISSYVMVSDAATLGDERVYFVKDTKYVSATRNTKLDNASSESNTALANASSTKGWSAPVATYWVQNDGATSYIVSNLTGLKDNLPIYVLTQKTDENGKPAADATVSAYAAKLDSKDTVSFSLPAADTNGNGCAIAIVQPTQDNGNVVITGPEKLYQEENKTEYDVEYTTTYTMSKTLKSQIESFKNGINDKTCQFSFTVQLDPTLTAKTDVKDYSFTSPIFDIDSVEATNNSTLTAKVKLKSDWEDHIDELTTIPMVLKGVGTGTFNSDDFNSHKVLNTTGTIQGTINNGGSFLNVSINIPANICQTELVPLQEVTLSFDVNGGTGTVDSMSEYLDETGTAEFVIPSTSLTRTDYTFAGWSTEKDGSVEYKAGDSLKTDTDMTLYAVWTKNEDPTPEPVVPSTPTSKSKTAKWVKEGETAEVTLSLPSESYKKTIDVVFVVDNAYGKDNKDATTKASEILTQLEKSATNFEAVNVGLVVSGGYDAVLNDADTDNSDANTTIDISNLSLFNMLDEANANSLTKLKSDIVSESWKSMEGRKGSNIQAGLEAARQLLAKETAADSSDKYIVLISDGGAFSWYENDAVYSKAYNDTTSTANYHFCNPNDFAQVYGEKSEDYSLNFDALMAKDEATVDAYSISKPADSEWPSKNSTNSQYAGYYPADEISGSLRNQAADLTQESVRDGYVTSREAALYHAAKTIQDINTNNEANVIFVSLPYNPGSAALFEVTESFKQWLSDKGYVSLYRMNGAEDKYDGTAYAKEVKSAEDVFTSINNELVYLIDAGSTVTDTIGSDFTLSDMSSFKLTVDGKEVTGVVNGNTVNFGTAKSDGSYSYSVTYDETSRTFTWYINEKVSKAGGVKLTYQLTLSNKQTAAGTYTVDTNEKATLNPKDSSGKSGTSEDFEKPTLEYTVEKKSEPTSTPTPTPTFTPTPSSKPTATPTSKPSTPSTPSSKPISPTNSSSGKSSSTYKAADTGDTSDMYLWIGITGIAVIAGVCMIIARKKQA